MDDAIERREGSRVTVLIEGGVAQVRPQLGVDTGAVKLTVRRIVVVDVLGASGKSNTVQR